MTKLATTLWMVALCGASSVGADVGDNSSGRRVVDGCAESPVVIEADDAVTVDVRSASKRPCASSKATQVLKAVRVLGTDLAHETPAVLFSQSAFALPSIVVSFMPGDAWEPTAVEVEFEADAAVDEIIVDVAAVTVMQCSAEGPHWEFWDLKPQTSAWVPWPGSSTRSAEGAKTRVFKTKAKTTMPSPAAAPRSTWSDAEVKMALTAKRVDLSAWAFDTCAPVIGEHRLRVRAKINDNVVNVTELRLRPALGC